ncbi:hypothetical protein D3C83_173820 [compost metagenome]
MGVPSAFGFVYASTSGGPWIFHTMSPFSVVLMTTACIAGWGVSRGFVAFTVR